MAGGGVEEREEGGTRVYFLWPWSQHRVGFCAVSSVS